MQTVIRRAPSGALQTIETGSEPGGVDGSVQTNDGDGGFFGGSLKYFENPPTLVIERPEGSFVITLDVEQGEYIISTTGDKKIIVESESTVRLGANAVVLRSNQPPLLIVGETQYQWPADPPESVGDVLQVQSIDNGNVTLSWDQ